MHRCHEAKIKVICLATCSRLTSYLALILLAILRHRFGWSPLAGVASPPCGGPPALPPASVRRFIALPQKTPGQDILSQAQAGVQEVTSVQGQPRRLSDLGMSASPPTSDIGLRRREPTLGARNGHGQIFILA